MPRTKQQTTLATATEPTTASDHDPSKPEGPRAVAGRSRAKAKAAEKTAGGQKGATEATAEPVDVNLVVLGGRLAADAEFRSYESGTSAMRFLVTVRLTEPRRRIDVIPVTLWEPARRMVRKPPVRGDRVWFTGNVQRRFWDGPDGRRSRIEVIAHRVDIGVVPETLVPSA